MSGEITTGSVAFYLLSMVHLTLLHCVTLGSDVSPVFTLKTQLSIIQGPLDAIGGQGSEVRGLRTDEETEEHQTNLVYTAAEGRCVAIVLCSLRSPAAANFQVWSVLLNHLLHATSYPGQEGPGTVCTEHGTNLMNTNLMNKDRDIRLSNRIVILYCGWGH